ncbi:uncharacterized protein FOMMEDRAFT_156838 [Fomitiporia mediterranea MF3/22]|uniref:uncharacterized protein n=1 Tax=Fomitiporia mediterranea (strain MF3/22) TaxID=694068 RepID=UPI00044081FD|nr:uncharacterized protein FOMMEDRAFT_156838 [Fomitiporia mediterranea MF3/22]EJD03430.1 hypothetical protein FOMMEDRAFT_156838 [Fomitiporia mediterranea MF3/22]
MPDSTSDALPLFNTSPAFRKTHPPDESWQFGDGLRVETKLGAEWKKNEESGWKTMNVDEMEKPLVYKMLISAIVPRPIAFVATLSDSGMPNLAPFSYFSLVSHNPPLVSVSFTLPSKGVKDTRENIKITKEFTVNIISEPFIEAANATSINAPPEVDEFAISGLTPLQSVCGIYHHYARTPLNVIFSKDVVKPPRVRESAVSFECELFHFLDIAPSAVLPDGSSTSPSTTVILGRIRRAHIRHAVLSQDEITVDTAALRAIARIGGVGYARVGEGFDLARPSWREDGETVRQILQRKGVHDRDVAKDAERNAGL